MFGAPSGGLRRTDRELRWRRAASTPPLVQAVPARWAAAAERAVGQGRRSDRRRGTRRGQPGSAATKGGGAGVAGRRSARPQPARRRSKSGGWKPPAGFEPVPLTPARRRAASVHRGARSSITSRSSWPRPEQRESATTRAHVAEAMQALRRATRAGRDRPDGAQGRPDPRRDGAPGRAQRSRATSSARRSARSPPLRPRSERRASRTSSGARRPISPRGATPVDQASAAPAAERGAHRQPTTPAQHAIASRTREPQ